MASAVWVLPVSTYSLKAIPIRGVRLPSRKLHAIKAHICLAWTWNTTNTNLASLTDPQNRTIYEMHQYLDSDGSGTSSTCVSSNVGVQRVEGATAWLKANKKLGILGEFAGGANTICQQAVEGMIEHLKYGRLAGCPLVGRWSVVGKLYLLFRASERYRLRVLLVNTGKSVLIERKHRERRFVSETLEASSRRGPFSYVRATST